MDHALTERIFQEYYLRAGVCATWLDRLRPIIQHSDYRQTGQNFWENESGIITEPIGNPYARGTERQNY
jgi:hypothetical protein